MTGLDVDDSDTLGRRLRALRRVSPATPAARRLLRRARRASYEARPVRSRLTRNARRAWRESSSIAFVCLGNICRSPFAEAVARACSPDDVTWLSAGSYPVPGRTPPADAVAAAGALGFDLRGHRSRVLTGELMAGTDAIFVFDDRNYRELRATYPAAKHRVHLLGALSPRGPLFVDDPFRRPREDFDLTYGRILALIRGAHDRDDARGRRGEVSR